MSSFRKYFKMLALDASQMDFDFVVAFFFFFFNLKIWQDQVRQKSRVNSWSLTGDCLWPWCLEEAACGGMFGNGPWLGYLYTLPKKKL